MADNANPTDPQENPTNTGHLPVSGEVGNGPVSYHDPVTQPIDDTTDENDNVDTEIADEPTPANGDAAGLS